MTDYTSNEAVGVAAVGSARGVRVLDVSLLFREHHAALVRLALLLVGDQETAEDVVQDVFTRLHAKGDRFSTATNTPGKAIRVGYTPYNIVVTPNGKTAYVIQANSALSSRSIRRPTLLVSPSRSPGTSPTTS